MKKLLFLLLVVLAAAASASAGNGKWNKVAGKWSKEKEKDKDKDKEKECDKPTSNVSNKAGASIGIISKNNSPSRVEEYVWMLPREQEGEKMNEEELKKGIVDLYKWYLQNESRINNNESLKTTGKELVFPFKVDVKTLQQYFQFVKNNFPGLSEDDLDDSIEKPVNNRKKYAPVTVRDDMENPMTIPANK